MKWLIAVAAALALGMIGIVATHERGGPSSPAGGSHEKIATISTGETVDLASHLREGSWAVVEFTADW